jgi:hypothetical protein
MVCESAEATMTAQIHENLVLDGKRLTMASCPDLPEGHPRIVEVDPEVARTKPGSHMYFTTACWRGYRGTWKIARKRLYLTHLSGRKRLTGKAPLFADWVDDILRVPQGKLLRYVHMGFGSKYEQEIRLTIEKGVVTSRRVFDNRTHKYVS